MNIKKEEVVRTDGVYRSQLYSNWFAAQIIVMRGDSYFRIRYPYNSEEKAKQAIDFFNNKIPVLPQINYKAIIHQCDRNGHVR